MFGSWFHNAGDKLRKICAVLFIIDVILLLVGGLFAIGFAWIDGLVSFLLSLIFVPLIVVVTILLIYLSSLPTFALAEAASKSTECLAALQEMMKSEEEKKKAEPEAEIDPRELPTWKQVQMLKRGQMVQFMINEEGKQICPICNSEHTSEMPVCENCGMFFYTKRA